MDITRHGKPGGRVRHKGSCASAKKARKARRHAWLTAYKQNAKQKANAKRASLDCAPIPIVLRKLGQETKFERETRKQESMAHYEAMRRGSTVKASTGRNIEQEDQWYRDWYRETWGEDC